MQRIWVVVLSVWAMLALVAVLAWSSRPVTPASQTAAQQVIMKGAHGKQRLVVLRPATHATTATSAAVQP